MFANAPSTNPSHAADTLTNAGEFAAEEKADREYQLKRLGALSVRELRIRLAIVNEEIEEHQAALEACLKRRDLLKEIYEPKLEADFAKNAIVVP